MRKDLIISLLKKNQQNQGSATPMQMFFGGSYPAGRLTCGPIALIGTLFWLGWWLAAVGLLLWVPLRWWPGDSLWLVQILNYFMPWLLIGLIPGIIIATLARRFGLAISLTVPVLFIGLNYAPLFLPRFNFALADDAHLKVMSYNIWRRNQDLPATIAVIARENPDILLLQETQPVVAEQIRAGWAAAQPDARLYLAAEPDMEQAVISRFPIISRDTDLRSGRLQGVTLETPGGPLLVWNIHTSQPILWAQHYQQLANLAQKIDTTQLPLIVGGDFNTTDQSEAYQLIEAKLGNAHWEAGWSFGFSFPAHPQAVKGVPVPASVVRIDHIFHSDHLFAISARTLSQAGGSDHFPVVAEFILVQKSTEAQQ